MFLKEHIFYMRHCLVHRFHCTMSLQNELSALVSSGRDEMKQFINSEFQYNMSVENEE